MNKTVFISYNWISRKLTSDIENLLIEYEIGYTKDSKDLQISDSLIEFMGESTLHPSFICVLTDKYAKSLNCMYEFCLHFSKSENPCIHIILDDISKYDYSSSNEYVDYWGYYSENELLEFDKVKLRLVKQYIKVAIDYIGDSLGVSFDDFKKKKNFDVFLKSAGKIAERNILYIKIQKLLKLSDMNSDLFQIELDKYTDEYSKDWNYYYLLAYKAYKEDKYELAEQYYEKGLKLTPTQKQFYINYAILLSNNLNKPEQAIRLYEIAKSKFDFNSKDINDYAILLLNIESRVLDAVKMLKSTVEDDYNGSYNLAQYYNKIGDYGTADYYFTKSLEFEDINPIIYSNYGYFKVLKLGQAKSGCKYFLQGLVRGDIRPNIYQEFLNLLLKENKLDVLLKEFESVTQNDLERLDYFLSILYFFLSKMELAISKMSDYIVIHDSDINALHTLASFHYLKGDMLKSKNLYIRILNVDSSNKLALENITKIEQILNK